MKEKHPLFLKVSIFILWFFVINISTYHWKSKLEKNRQENLLQSVRADQNRYIIPRYDLSTGENTGDFLKYIPESGSYQVIILCGMSQMYAINDKKKDDLTISELMDDMLTAEGSRVFGLSAPNLCNEEALLLLLASIADKERKASVFIYGICFDKFRNIDLRPSYQQLLRRRSDLEERWIEIAELAKTKYPMTSNKMLTTIKIAKENMLTKEKSIENDIRIAFSRLVPIIGARKELNAWLQIQLYLLRNKIFKIKTDSKRPMIKSRYELNQEFIELIIDVANQFGVLPIFYNIPINPLAENPYISFEYEEFKSWISALSKRRKILYANLEDIVPKEEWGEFMGGPDFKHFKGEGHRRTAEELVRRFHPYLVNN